MTRSAGIYIGIVIACGFLQILIGATSWQSTDRTIFLTVLILGLIASFLKVTIPGIPGTMSMNFIFILVGISRLSLGEALIVGAGSSIIQTIWHRKNRGPLIHAIFNIALLSIVIGVSHGLFHCDWFRRLVPSPDVRLLFVSLAYFLLNTGAVAGVISITGDQRFWPIWRDSYMWSCAYYMVGASAVGIFNLLDRSFGWEMPLLVLPIAFLAYRSYRMRIDALEKARIHAEDERKHLEEVATLHLRTIRALALAIEAKDTTTGEHLHRVHTYAMVIAEELGLTGDDLSALAAAAILHDIGKIAVPEYIISKPGKLSREEFEKMKIHPLVGGEIIESVRFPYPVAPIVSAHHEKWDGSGYPHGLKGEEIPIGARILSAVDCLDALASDRQYRRALPIDQAMAFVVSESGKAFDPKVVDILRSRYQDFADIARSTKKDENLKLSLNAKIERGTAPDAGLERGLEPNNYPGALSVSFVDRMAEAFAEARSFDRFDHVLSSATDVPQLLLAVTAKLRETIPFDACAVFLKSGEWLVPCFAHGTDADYLRLLHIRVGTGLSGWVAEHRTALLNGNPGAESGLNDRLPVEFSLTSALVIPLETERGILGVLTVYSKTRDAFNGSHLRLFMAIRARLACALEASLVIKTARSATGVYPGCDMPDAGALLEHLHTVLPQARESEPVVVMIARAPGLRDVENLPLALHRLSSRLDEFVHGPLFVARVGEDDLAVICRCSTLDCRAFLRSALLAAFTQIDLGLQVIFGSAQAPSDAAEGERLVAFAAIRLLLQSETFLFDTNPQSLSALGLATQNLGTAIGPVPVFHTTG